MKLLNLLIIIMLFKILAKVGMDLSWWWWLLVGVFYIIDVHSQAVLEQNVMTNGKNIHSIGDWLNENLAQKDEPEKGDGEDVLH